MSHLVNQSGLSRRALNLTLLASGLTAPFATTAAFAQASGSQAPRRGGTVRVALAVQSSADTFDSARYSTANDFIRGTSVYSYLTRLGDDGRPVPEVATSWEVSDGARTWTFKLRTDISFSDGSKLTPADVAFSILRHKNEAVASTAKSLVANITEIRAEDAQGLVVRLAQPDANVPLLLGLFQFAIVKDGTADFSKPVGSGPFLVEDFRPGSRTLLKRNPGYWKEGRPYLDAIEMIPIPDATARSNALLAGDVNMIINVGGSAIEQVKSSGSTEIFVSPSARYSAIQSSCTLAPQIYQNVTLGLAHLIDRPRLLNTVYRGFGEVANDTAFSRNSPYFNAELPQRELDLDRAKYYFLKANLGVTPVELVISDGAAQYSGDIAQLIQREGTRAGLNVTVKREPAESYWSSVAGKRPFFATSFLPRPDINMLLSLQWSSGAVWNFSKYDNPRLQALIAEARGSLDEAHKKQLYAEVQSIVYEAGVNVVPCYIYSVDGISNKLKGLKPSSLGNLAGYNFGDTAWLEA
jgi:peptide/nickel transport system substrate-binding protein